MKKIALNTLQYILLFNMLMFSFEAKAQRSLDRLVDLRGYWKFNIGDDMNWVDASYDDRDWEDIFVPADWENEGFHGYDGYAWYRVGFELDLDRDDNNELYLDLGYVDDVDEVYINGVLIGRTGSFPPRFGTAYNSKRFYFIPNEVLNLNGVNTIAVRVFDATLNGGIVSGRIGIYINRYPVENSMILSGLWKFERGANREWLDPDFDDSDWARVVVPGFWHEFKNIRPGRFGTYRKRFQLPERMRNLDDLVLVLGKIDDYDRVYLNGHLIGETYDNGRYGTSDSYQVRRVYGIDEDHINRLGDNIITVEVEDIGGDAGIYEGPVGITTRNDFRYFIRFH